jgi:hypothetical protein
MGAMNFVIFAKGEPQHTVVAVSEEAAIKRWLDEQGYDCIEHAASEYFCTPADFRAERWG